MKTFIVFLVTGVVCLSMCLPVMGGGTASVKKEGKIYVYHVPKTKPLPPRDLDREQARLKEEHMLERRDKKQEMYMQASQQRGRSVSGVSGGGGYLYLDANTGTINGVSAWDGDYTFVGSCTNNNSSWVDGTAVHASFFGTGDTLLGSTWNFVYGGTNVKYSDMYYTNAFAPGDTGFFQINTSYPYDSVTRVEYSIYGNEASYTPANADIGFVGKPTFTTNSSEYLKVSGQVKNSSRGWLTYWNEVYFVVYGSDGKALQVDYTYVLGSEYNYGSGTTDTGLQPGETGTFSNTFLNTKYKNYSSYQASFEWYEDVKFSNLGETEPPFGSFDTPLDGTTARSSVPVTGWALDDTAVEKVKLYRHSGGSLVYIGDASFVEGARPDVEAAFPEYPNNSSAGWGYMMLTNFLPGGGNGTYTLEAIAIDSFGRETSLGTKTFICDNANAVKPFGAIDTPPQGGTASGTDFVNWGWVLTPQPNKIPVDGSTIDVWIDGVNVGQPTYNIYRSDIATKFPDYANSQGAVGYFYLDTTAYENGVHTIQWTAKDDAGNSDGIGSRYFTINNSSSKPTPSTVKHTIPKTINLKIPIEDISPVRYRKGYRQDSPLQTLFPDKDGTLTIQLKSTERLEIQFEEPVTILTPLPIGSTFDTHQHTFYWQPGPVFKGDFDFYFQNTPGLSLKKITVRLTEKDIEK